MNSPNGTLFLMAWNRPWHGMTTAKIMPALLEFLYREFCRARLAEMRKPLLIRPDGLEVPEDACFDGHADRWSGLDDLQDGGQRQANLAGALQPVLPIQSCCVA
jgi:hypothetical protein